MRITQLIRRRGDKVVTIRPFETVAYLLATLDEHHIGGAPVTAGAARHLAVTGRSERAAI